VGDDFANHLRPARNQPCQAAQLPINARREL